MNDIAKGFTTQDAPDIEPRPGGKTIIRISAGDLHLAWRQSENALIEAKCPVYVRNQRLVWPMWRWEKVDDVSDEKTLVCQIVEYNRVQLHDMLTHHAAKYEKYDGRSKDWRIIEPPKEVVESLLYAKHWGFNSLRGIVNAPIMRVDGSLLLIEGYDDLTELWFKSSNTVRLPDLPERPTMEEAQTALAVLHDLLDEFAFEDEYSMAAALSATMTVCLKGLIPIAPVYLITAPEPRSGKTYLVKIVSGLATGHKPVNIAGSEGHVEMEKRIETALRSGRVILSLNNLPNGMSVQSEALCQASTEGEFAYRYLGEHAETKCDCRGTTIFLNGNNITVGSDLVERTAHIRLDARMPFPGERTFKNKPMEMVVASRGRYLGAVFTVARWGIQNNERFVKKGLAVAGFEDWSRFVQRPLMALGVADPLGNRETLRKTDPDRSEFEEIINALVGIYGKGGAAFTVSDLEGVASNFAELENLMMDYGKVNAKKFGKRLKKHVGRISEKNWELIIDGTTGGANRYRIRQLKVTV